MEDDFGGKIGVINAGYFAALSFSLLYVCVRSYCNCVLLFYYFVIVCFYFIILDALGGIYMEWSVRLLFFF